MREVNRDFEQWAEASPRVGGVFRDWVRNDIMAPGALDKGTKELLFTVLIAAAGYLPGMRVHAGRALENGITPEQMREAMAIMIPILGSAPFLNADPELERFLSECAGGPG